VHTTNPISSIFNRRVSFSSPISSLNHARNKNIRWTSRIIQIRLLNQIPAFQCNNTACRKEIMYVLDATAKKGKERKQSPTLLQFTVLVVNTLFRRTVRDSVHTDGRSDGPSVGRSYRVNTFCPTFLSGPTSGPTLCPTYSCQSNHG
jgi:hypothetical protein